MLREVGHINDSQAQICCRTVHSVSGASHMQDVLHSEKL